MTAGLVVLLTLTTSPALAADSSSESVALAGPQPAAAPTITGRSELDIRIRHLAEQRGYVRRPTASAPLVTVGGVRLLAEVADAWEALRRDALGSGHDLRLVAGFRDIATQRALFLGRLRGNSAGAIEATLRWTAPPGYSKHHTGTAVDITVRGLRPGAFGGSAAYAWLAADDYRRARTHGFLPSYPPDGPPQGPEPEPWEWIYVGPAATDPPSLPPGIRPA